MFFLWEESNILFSVEVYKIMVYVYFFSVSYYPNTNHNELRWLQQAFYPTILNYIYCIFENAFGFYFAKNLENIFKIALLDYFKLK